MVVFIIPERKMRRNAYQYDGVLAWMTTVRQMDLLLSFVSRVAVFVATGPPVLRIVLDLVIAFVWTTIVVVVIIIIARIVGLRIAVLGIIVLFQYDKRTECS